MKISPIASGSNGNCIYVETDSAKIIIDMGISFREFSRRMEGIGRSPAEIDACFVTHEHADHISGVGVLSRKLGIPIYMNRMTRNYCTAALGDIKDLRIFNSGQGIMVGSSVVKSFCKPHDAGEPVSFMVEDNGKKFGVITDTGFPCSSTKRFVAEADSLLLESNYDPSLLKRCGYPEHLKSRIAGKKGHLSNEDSGLLVLECATSRLKSVILGHISANSNTPEIAYLTFKSIVSNRKDLDGMRIGMASRHCCTGLFDVC